MKQYFAERPADLREIASAIIEQAGNSRLFAFYGEMGAGKTTLILKILKYLGVQDKGSSPTFSIVNEYLTDKGEAVYHFDFYRIEDITEVYDIGYEDYFFSDAYCFIEWPEKIGELLPDDSVKIHISVCGETREIQMDIP